MSARPSYGLVELRRLLPTSAAPSAAKVTTFGGGTPCDARVQTCSYVQPCRVWNARLHCREQRRWLCRAAAALAIHTDATGSKVFRKRGSFRPDPHLSLPASRSGAKEGRTTTIAICALPKCDNPVSRSNQTYCCKAHRQLAYVREKRRQPQGSGTATGKASTGAPAAAASAFPSEEMAWVDPISRRPTISMPVQSARRSFTPARCVSVCARRAADVTPIWSGCAMPGSASARTACDVAGRRQGMSARSRRSAARSANGSSGRKPPPKATQSLPAGAPTLPLHRPAYPLPGLPVRAPPPAAAAPFPDDLTAVRSAVQPTAQGNR